MSLRKSKGNMYDWVTHVWSPMVGCSHQCAYCYVRKYRALPEVPVLNEEDLPDLAHGRVIFVGHMCDMFSGGARPEDVTRVLAHCRNYDNEYVLQTKNPHSVFRHFEELPPRRIIGTTVETNRAELVAALSKAPPPEQRARLLREIGGRTFLTVEPILDFDPEPFAEMIAGARPDFVNIGADSKGHGLPEPSGDKVLELVRLLNDAGVTIRKKVNLGRLIGSGHP